MPVAGLGQATSSFAARRFRNRVQQLLRLATLGVGLRKRQCGPSVGARFGRLALTQEHARGPESMFGLQRLDGDGPPVNPMPSPWRRAVLYAPV
jgi:hypothetical protein